MTKIELTPEQLAQVPVVRDEWINTIFSCRETNEKEVTKGINFMYKEMNLDKPEIVFFDNPDSMKQFANKQINKKPTEPISYGFNSLWDSAGWVAFYDYFKKVGVLDELIQDGKVTKKDMSRFDKYTTFVNAMPVLCIYMDEMVTVCRSPKQIYKDIRFRPHMETGPAFLWRDNYKHYFWRGVKLDDPRIIEQPEVIDKQYILNTKNLEICRIIQERIGNKRFTELLDPTIVHQDTVFVPTLDRKQNNKTVVISQERQLLDVQFNENIKIRFLSVEDPSTRPDVRLHNSGKRDLIEVPGDCTTCRDAIAWSFNMKPDEYNPTIEV